MALQTAYVGNRAKNQVGQKNPLTISDRMFALYKGVSNSTYGPTETHKMTVNIIKEQLNSFEAQHEQLSTTLSTLLADLQRAGLPPLAE